MVDSPPSKQGAREKRFDAESGRFGAGVFRWVHDKKVRVMCEAGWRPGV